MTAKISRLALLLAATATFQWTLAATPVGSTVPGPMERELHRQVDRYVTYPILDRGHSMDGSVVVSFMVNAEGRIEVLSAYSANQDLCDYVLAQLHRVDIGDNPNGSWRIEHMRFNFHPEA